MKEVTSLELWARETRSRALGTIAMATVAVLGFYSLFYARLLPHLFFDLALAFLCAVQLSRAFFLLKFTSLDDKTWLKWNDYGIVAYSLAWGLVSLGIAYTTTTSDGVLNATILVLVVGYLSNGSQFFAWSRSVYLTFMFSVLIPGIWISTHLSTVWYEKVMLALLPMVYAAFQMKTRRALWSAMQGIGRTQSNMKEAIDSFPGGLVLLRGKVYQRVNHYAAHLLGKSERDIVGKTLGFSDQEAEFKLWVEEFSRGGKDLDSFEQTLRTPSGVREHFIVLRRSANNPEDIIVASLDIAALTQAQRELELERQRATQVSRSVAGLAGEIDAPLASLTEQVLVRQVPDLATTRDSLMRIQLVINRLKAS